jgi:hypothetical protein
MLPVKLWIVECWRWGLHAGGEIREQLLILFKDLSLARIHGHMGGC